MTKGVLKCFYKGKQYNLVYENNTYKVYCDFGRVLFEICTNNEKNAIESFKNWFGKDATYDKFYYGFDN